MLFLLTGDMTGQIKLISYVGLGVFGFLVCLFIGLHIWWARKNRHAGIEHVGSDSILHFLKVNIFAVFATLWAAGLFAAIMALINTKI